MLVVLIIGRRGVGEVSRVVGELGGSYPSYCHKKRGGREKERDAKPHGGWRPMCGIRSG
jgi:hypothetical protein